MPNGNLLMLVFAFVLFVLAACPPYNPDSPYRTRLIAAGLAFWVGSQFLARFL